MGLSLDGVCDGLHMAVGYINKLHVFNAAPHLLYPDGLLTQLRTLR